MTDLGLLDTEHSVKILTLFFLEESKKQGKVCITFFSLNENLPGMDMAKILKGFGMRILLYDIVPDTSWAKENNLEYVSLITLLEESDVISLHCPLTSETKQIINAGSLSLMRRKPILINTSRGGLVDTVALINALKQKLISGAVLDVYEEESKYFFSDLPLPITITKLIIEEILMSLINMVIL